MVKDDLGAKAVPATALAAAISMTSSLKAKANKYKHMSKWFTVGIAVSTVAIPVLIGLPLNNDVVQRAVPSGLAAVAALCGVLLQLEKPQERWNLYRRYQRIVEGEVFKFSYEAPPYDSDNRGHLLAIEISRLQLDLHDEWAGLVPRSADAANLASGAVKPHV